MDSPCYNHKYENLIKNYREWSSAMETVKLGILGLGTVGSGVLEMIEKPEIDNQDGKWEHIALECDNIQEQYDRLIAAGATVKMPLEFTTVLKGRNGYPDTYCCGVHVWGSDGEEIELCQHRGAWGWDQPGTQCPAWEDQ